MTTVSLKRLALPVLLSLAATSAHAELVRIYLQKHVDGSMYAVRSVPQGEPMPVYPVSEAVDDYLASLPVEAGSRAGKTFLCNAKIGKFHTTAGLALYDASACVPEPAPAPR